MCGWFKNVQTIIKNMYPKALYTHYVSHSLNQCLSNAAKSQDVRNTFDIVSEFVHILTIRQNKLQSLKIKYEKLNQMHNSQN